MNRLAARWLILTFALLITIRVLPLLGITGVKVTSFPLLFLASLAIAALNLLAHPVLWLAKTITVGLSCLTLGLWSLALSLFVNTLVFYFVGTLHWGFKVTGFGPAFMGALMLSLVNAFLNGIFRLAVQSDRGTRR